MDKNLQKTPKRGRPSKNLIANSPFSIFLSRILQDRSIVHSALEKDAGLSGGTIKSVLQSGNPTIQTVWVLEKALGLPRGYLCSCEAREGIEGEVAPAGNNGAPCPTSVKVVAEAEQGEDEEGNVVILLHGAALGIQEALVHFCRHLLTCKSSNDIPLDILLNIAEAEQTFREQIEALQAMRRNRLHNRRQNKNKDRVSGA